MVLFATGYDNIFIIAQKILGDESEIGSFLLFGCFWWMLKDMG